MNNRTIWYICIQGFAILAIILFSISNQFRTRTIILIVQAIALILLAVHYFLIEAWTGVTLVILNCIITVLMIFKGKFIFFQRRLFLYLLLIIISILTIVFWEWYFSIFALLWAIMATLSRRQFNTQKLRILFMFSCVSRMIYNVFVSSYGWMIAESIRLWSSVIWYLRFKNERKLEPKKWMKSENYENQTMNL